MSPLTLLYHHVNNEFVNNITITPSDFRAQLELLHTQGYRVISLATLLQSLTESLVALDKCIFITFDDGYQDFYTTAFPILQEFGYTATIFPVIEAIGHWNEWNRRAPYVAYHLSWSEIDELLRYGVTFGCHTLAHHSLVRFDEARLCYELETAKNVISQRIGQPVEALSYPYGDYNDLVQRIAAQLFQVAFAVDQGQWDWRVDRLAIRRLKIGPTTSLTQLQKFLDSFEDNAKAQNFSALPLEMPEIKT